MLGESKGGSITQSAFIRSLLSSYIRRIENRSGRLGGIFGAEVGSHSGEVLKWNRPQQAAFLIYVWRVIAEAIRECQDPWAEHLRNIPLQQNILGYQGDVDLDLAFAHSYSLISRDQGVRGVLQVTKQQKFDPKILCDVQILECDGKNVLVLQALRNPNVPYHEYDGRAYIREGSRKRLLSYDEKQHLTLRRNRDRHQGPWRCDRCGSIAGMLMQTVLTDQGVRKSYTCKCGGEFWPL